jgi:hypothetical protein
MENIILQKTRYLKALMLTMLVGLFAFGASAQSFTSSNVPVGPYYAGAAVTVSYEATGFPGSTRFILWDDVDNNDEIDVDETIFGMSTVQDASEDIDFNWPGNDVQLKLGGFSGNVVEGEIISFTDADISTLGTTSGGTFKFFNQASTRRLSTNQIDLDTSDPVTFSFILNDFGFDATNPIEVVFSTDGFATETALTEDNSGLTEFENGGAFEFTLPSGAKTATTRFRIQQTGTVDYGNNQVWAVDINTLEVEIGETYQLVTPPGLEVDQFINIITPQLTINDILNDDGISFGNAYPGEDLTIEAELLNADLTALSFAATVTNTDNGETYLLETGAGDITIDNTAGVKTISLVGTIPSDITYYNVGNGWDVDIYAYDGTDIILGTSEFYDFTAGLPTDFVQIGGTQNGVDGLAFDEAGERSLTTVPYNISSQDGVLTFNAARKDNVLSPSGTNLIVEYSTDGETYNELVSLDLNSLTATGLTEIVFDTWPAGVVSSTTQFRIRQESNNGSNLDAYIIDDLLIENATNVIAGNIVDRTFADANYSIFSPNITLDNFNVGGDGLAFPMENLDLTYTINEGSFPANTEATAYVQRTGDPDFDIQVGTTTDVSGGTIPITVPPLEAGDYTVYFSTLNGQTYFGTTLSIFDLGLDITSVEYNDPVLVAGDEFTYPGSAITVNYTLQGTAGTGAELMMSVYDNNPDVDDWVMIGSTTDLNTGAITATLPTGIDYDANPDVRLSIGTSGTYDNFFYETIVSGDFEGDPLPSSIFESSTGTSNNFPSKPDSFTGSGVRSATTVPFDFSYGGQVDIEIDEDNGTHLGTYNVKLQGSIDGTNWEDLDEEGVGLGSIVTLFADVPNSLWSANTQFRVIYNEDEAFGVNENVIQINEVIIETPEFMEASFDDEPFNLINPSLSVSDYDKTAFAMGEEVSINYNAVGFPASTEYAAVVEQGGEFYVAGTSADEDAGTITAVMPIAFQNPLNNYDLKIVPFEPASAGGDYKQGETILINSEEDFLIINGQDPTWANNYTIFNFDQAGDRELLTTDFDLSNTTSATLNFNFNTFFGYGSYAVNANKNTVPRLEVSTDGGATFQVVPVYELDQGEQQIYDDGLLYLQQGYGVELPASALTEATHFRFSQPLNLGSGANSWSVDNISLTLNDDNRLPDFQFEDNINGNNPTTITITAPSLDGYDWMQADLDDAVFNGETFDYSWNLAEGFNSSDVDAFPTGTNFTFYLEESGDYVINPDTGMPFVLGTTTSLGTFVAEVPFFVVNGNYNVRLAASIEIEGENGPEDYFFYGDEETGEDVGDLDIFLRAAELVYQGDENANIYAGQDVEFAIQLENDETNNAPTSGLFANLLLVTNEGDYLLAAQEGLGNITVAMPTWFNGNADFKLQLTENEALGDVGTIINDSELENLEENINNFSSEIFSDFVEAEMSGNVQVVQTRKFKKEEFNDVFDVSFDIELSNIVGNTEIRLEYSTNDGESWNYINNWFWGNGFQNNVFDDLNGQENDMEQNGFMLRFVQYNPEGSFLIDDLDLNFGGQSFDDTNMEVYPANFTIGNATKSNIAFDNTSGRRLVTTRTFTVEELENTTAFGFDLTFDQLPGDLTTDQYLVFEYSTDGGSTYTELQQYPEMDAEMTLNGERFLYAVSTDMKENGVKFRWRQEENKGNITLDNLSFLFGETIPFDYIDASEFINQQAFLITSSPSEACISDEITISYEIRGRLGENDFLKVIYSDAFGSSNELSPEFIADGATGDITFELPSNAVTAGVNNQFFKFELEGNVETQTAGSFIQINGTETEESTEIVAPLNTEASFTVNDPLACESEDVMVELDNADLQDYFLYEIVDAADGTVLGSLTRDPEMPENQINIGQITTTTDLELRVTAQSSAGTVCNTLVTSEETVEILQNFELYSYANPDQNWKVVNTGASLNSCNGANEVWLSVRRLLDNGNTTTGGTTLVEWFRDDLNNQVAIGVTQIDDTDMELSGEYFARVTTESCVYTTERIQINLEPTPDQPTVTVVSGDLAACSTADPVVLEAPADFEYYLWNTGETSQSITVEDQGSYTVQVSNLPFNIGCPSPASAAIDVDRYEIPEISLRNDNTNEIIGAGEEILICESFDVELLEDGVNDNDGVVQVLRDGLEYAVMEPGTDDFTIDESGTYSFIWNFDAINVAGCSATSNEFVVTIVDQPTASPALTATGDLTFCEDQGTVTLTAPAGFDYYRWLDGGAITNSSQGFTNSNELEVSTSGTYTVQVGNAAGCWSPESNAIEVNVILEPTVPGTSGVNGFASFNQANVTCGEGVVEFDIENEDNVAMTYQLYNGNTGQPSGNPVTIAPNTFGTIISDVVSEDGTPFYVEAMYADGTGCSNVDPSVVVNAQIRNITLEVQGAQLIANYSNTGVSDIRWYRDGVLLTNATSNSITITDAAEYSVEVEYATGCIVTASSADIAGKVLGNQDAMAMKVVSYPNPAQADVTLNVNSQYMGKHEVIITSMTGQVMMQSSFEKSSFEAEHAMDVANLEEGIYNVQIRHDGLTQNVRIIKK